MRAQYSQHTYEGSAQIFVWVRISIRTLWVKSNVLVYQYKKISQSEDTIILGDLTVVVNLLTFLPFYTFTLLSLYPFSFLPLYPFTSYSFTLLPFYLLFFLPFYFFINLSFNIFTLLPFSPFTLLLIYPFICFPFNHLPI